MRCVLRSTLMVLMWVNLCFLAQYSCHGQSSADSEIDNARVIEMSQMALGDDIIIARIKTGTCNFLLSDSDLAQLKKAGVSDKVVAVMLETSVLINARVKVDGNLVSLRTFGQTKVGSRLESDATLGIKSVKEKAYFQGQHASVIAGVNPDIEVELPPRETIDNYIVVRMDIKKDRREFEYRSAGMLVGAKSGVNAEKIVKTSHEYLGGHRYKIHTRENLKGGEYVIYVVGSADYDKGVYGEGYDFTVE